MASIRPKETLSLRERNKREKLARISAAARALFEEQGYDLTTIREIARRADVGLGTISFYAKDKRELLFLIFRDDLEALFDAAQKQVPQNAPVLDQLMAFFTPILEFLQPYGSMARIMVRESMSLQGALADEYRTLTAKIRHALEGIIRSGQAKGAVRKDVVMEAQAEAIWGLFRFYADDWLRDPDPSLKVAQTRLAMGLRLLVEGLSNPVAGRAKP